MTAASRRCANPRPAHARSSADSSAALNTGTSFSVTLGGRSPVIGSGRSSSAASHLKNCCRPRYWLLAYALLYRPSRHTIHSWISCPRTWSPPRPGRLPGPVGSGEPLHRLAVGTDRLSGLALSGQAQTERADLRLQNPGIQILALTGTTEVRRGHDALLLSKRTIPTTALPHHTAPKPRLWLTGTTRSGQPGAGPDGRFGCGGCHRA